jgi:2-keto-4-pentenoate hydratase/2-oxohepta-3-ene-1,7-dioic acid hydratase in catechol pathway
MASSRRVFLTAVAAGLASWRCSSGEPEGAGVTHYVRYRQGNDVFFGEFDGETIHKIEGDLFGSRNRTAETVNLKDVKLLYPVEPTKVLALAGNYLSHLGPGREPPEYAEPFYKPITCLQNPGDPIIFPPGAQEVHYEAELVIVIGKKAKRVSVEEAPSYILGYTCGNDVSEREWQNGALTGPENKDLQWWRAKGSDTFGPMGPSVAVGLDYEKSKIQSRVNGEVRQQQILSDLIEKPADIVSFVSQHVTLLPGDVIFTGTPGRTQALKPGDVVEIEIDGIGILSNPVQGPLT